MRPKARVLIADDDKQIRYLLHNILLGEGYDTIEASNGAEVIQILESEPPNFVILDIIMPKMDGFEALRQLRKHSQVPVIMLTAHKDMASEIECLNLGADDYVTKPFSTVEFLAHFRSVIRRTGTISLISPQSSFVCAHFQVNYFTRHITVAGTEMKLTLTESELLHELISNSEKVLTYQHLLCKVWGPEYSTEKEYLHTYIKRLRRKLEPDPMNPRYIVNISKTGYVFRKIFTTK